MPVIATILTTRDKNILREQGKDRLRSRLDKVYATEKDANGYVRYYLYYPDTDWQDIQGVYA